MFDVPRFVPPASECITGHVVVRKKSRMFHLAENRFREWVRETEQTE